MKQIKVKFNRTLTWDDLVGSTGRKEVAVEKGTVATLIGFDSSTATVKMPKRFWSKGLFCIMRVKKDLDVV